MQVPRIEVSELDFGNHTLTTGYQLNSGGDVHIYVMSDQIHVLIYQDERILRHAHAEAMNAMDLRPTKRAYPHTTNETFAYLMRNAGEALTFLGNFNWDRDWVRKQMAEEPFKAPTHLDF